MNILEFLPHTDWREHIAAYWIITEPDISSSGSRIYANGCSDLIYNAGESTVYFYPLEGKQQAIPLYPGKLYLGGTMTAYGVFKIEPGGLLTGIRFWPGGFYALFSQTMQPAVDSTIEFFEEELCTLMKQSDNLDINLNLWLDKRSTPVKLSNTGKYDFIHLRKRMYESGGQVTIEELSDDMCVSNRTLERIFKKNVGIPPKDFLRIVRFQEVLSRLRNTADKNGSQMVAKESLLQLAFDLGYYDHAHLTNEFKKYSGVLPSELSLFYKTGISGGRYF